MGESEKSKLRRDTVGYSLFPRGTRRGEALGFIRNAIYFLFRGPSAIIYQPRRIVRTIRSALFVLRRGGLKALRLRLMYRVSGQLDYDSWIKIHDTLTAADRCAIRQHIERLDYKPVISVIMPVYNTDRRWLRAAIDSVVEQLYDKWELCIADDASTEFHVKRILEEYRTKDRRIKVIFREKNGHISVASNSALELATGKFVALLDHDDVLPEHALYTIAVEVNDHRDADLIYSDEDKINDEGRRYDPYFKPDWNPDLFLSQNLVSHLGVYRTSIIRQIGGFRPGYEGSQDWDLAMRVVESIPLVHIRHVPHILYHWRAIRGSAALTEDQKNYVHAAQFKTLQSNFDRSGDDVAILPAVGGYWRIRYPLPQSAPHVTLLIPTRNGLSLLQRCLGSLFDKTTYPNFDVIILDNQSDDPDMLVYLSELERTKAVQVLRYNAPFNYAAINNYGVRHARGEIIGLLNNDVEVISPDWLEEMVTHALRPDIGAVGAMLYFPDDTIQHAGVILGLGVYGVAAHPYQRRPRGLQGQMGRALLVQNLTAVTAACLVLRRAVFEEVAGMDELNLPVAFNDVDLCLRIREAGYRNLWTPYAELYHRESASRGFDDIPNKKVRFQKERDYMISRWGEVLVSDPAYNPNLALDQDGFMLAYPPRVAKPWLAEEVRPGVKATTQSAAAFERDFS